MIALWNTLFYDPIYNTLVFFIDVIPGGMVALAVILLTVLIKFILSPLTRKAIVSQVRLKTLQPELKRINELYKDNKEEKAKKTFELYKERKINPFSGCLPILIQIPIIFGLYYVFLRGLDFSPDTLYSFISIPTDVSFQFLGLGDIREKSIIWALLAGASQFLHTYHSVSMKSSKEDVKDRSVQGKPSFQEQLGETMKVQMKYILPLFIAVVAYQISAAIAIYWTVSNLFALAQEYSIRKKTEKTKDIEVELISPTS
ncbi:MAG: YidC/Oxa1 family membrane protein insertase [Flavobacteriaceae bacterium]|jgi:YidC/Oxa1 family membrane protein insertase